MYWWSKALLGVATTGMLAAGATAFAATSSNSATGGFWSQVAADLHVSPTALENAIRTVELNRFKQYAQAHHLTPQQIAARTNAIEHGPIRVMVGRPMRPLLREALNGVINTAASQLHLTRAQLLQDLRQGKTLDQIAQAQGVSTSSLESAIASSLESRVQSLEQSGKLSASQASMLEQRIPQMVAQWMSRKIPLGHRWGGPWGGPWIRPAAQYVGLSVAQFRQDLRQGESPATIAANAGKSAAGLIAALENDAQARLGQAVQAGRISASQEQQLLSRMDQAIQNWVNRAPGAPPMP
jgi:AraC-like DNA-binding protein